ncbi:TolC family protein [Chitinophaga sp. GCM10012297]|uniref:TolC family protein n=1 Tax=Chitinophaga chungangae TaxID=2821488 RepID=A0ABS3YHS7_9BACT|nr:TolC family protein [Chitinophaga chungangae]MBO9154222.1 TolC family protein [Chitinophaga chungangae]
MFAQTQPTQPAAGKPSIEDRLVELAMANPAVKVRDYERAKTVSELNKAGSNWLNYITASANFNAVTLKLVDQAELGTQLYYPLWNVGVNVPLGSLFGKGSDVKIARRNLDIATAQQETARRQIKAMVLSKYRDYEKSKALLQLQQESVDEDQAAFEQAEAKYSTSSITYEEYNAASKRYKEGQAKIITLERDIAIAKLEVEEIIGVNLDDVINAK